MFGEDRPPERPEPGKLAMTLAGSVLVTALLGAVVFSLGGWAYRYRRLSIHEGRLGRLVERHPSAADVSQALIEEGGRLLAAPATEEDVRRLAVGRAGLREGDVLAKRQRYHDLRVFEVGGVVYFLYFDDGGRLSDYVVGGG
jgi:hypothetical protein